MRKNEGWEWLALEQSPLVLKDPFQLALICGADVLITLRTELKAIYHIKKTKQNKTKQITKNKTNKILQNLHTTLFKGMQEMFLQLISNIDPLNPILNDASA